MSTKELQFKLRDPLNTLDTATQTYGCRAVNPDICTNCYLDGVCAFVTPDHICRRPSRSWKRIYDQLIKEASEN